MHTACAHGNTRPHSDEYWDSQAPGNSLQLPFILLLVLAQPMVVAESLAAVAESLAAAAVADSFAAANAYSPAVIACSLAADTLGAR